MADDSDEKFEAVTSGASQSYPKQCSALRKNEYVLIKGKPCKIVDMSTSKTGKHGHAKVHLTGIDIFTQKKYEDVCPSTHNMEVPNVTRTEYALMDVDDQDGFVSLMSDDGNEPREDLKVDVKSDLGKELIAAFGNGDQVRVTVLSAMGDESIISCKKDTTGDKTS